VKRKKKEERKERVIARGRGFEKKGEKGKGDYLCPSQNPDLMVFFSPP